MQLPVKKQRMPHSVSRHCVQKERSIRSSECFFPEYFLCDCPGLFLGDSTCRANACTRTTGDTGISVDHVLRVSCRNSANRTLSFTGSAAYTRIVNYICHNDILLYALLIIIIYSNIEKEFVQDIFCE